MSIQIINQQEVLGKDFKIYGSVEEPLFLAKDVAEYIEHSQVSKMLRSIDEDEKLMGKLFLSGQNRESWFLTEDGIYEVLMQSRKPIAKQFKKEVKKILKEIRLHGGYMSVRIEESEEETVARAMRILERTIEQKEAIIFKQQETIELQQYDVELVERFVKSKDDALVRDVAKVLSDKGHNISQGLLFDKLVEWKWSYKDRSDNKYKPTQRAVEYGYLVLTQVEKDGKVHRTMKVTPKGQRKIFERLVQ